MSKKIPSASGITQDSDFGGFDDGATEEFPFQSLLTVHQAADLLNVSPATVRSLLRSQKISGLKVGGQWRICRMALMKFILDELS